VAVVEAGFVMAVDIVVLARWVASVIERQVVGNDGRFAANAACIGLLAFH
jgi:hypothetical protein